jgi:hypothetical protein
MLAAISGDERTVFENSVGSDYPRTGFAPVEIPFERLIDWIVSDAASGGAR